MRTTERSRTVRSSKKTFLRVQVWTILKCRKSGKERKRAWLSWDLLESKRKMHRQWKKGQVMWEEYRDAARLSKDRVRNAKAQLELDLVRGVKKSKKGFYRHISWKRKVQEGAPLFVSNTDRVVTADKVKVLNNFFA